MIGTLAVTGHSNCINCGQPMTVASATAFICKACGMIEFGSPADTSQQKQQQQQQSQDKKK
jgi:predicted RNA-binding Zn-ribbon protein involved in translation (DUF1610 family)